MSDVRTSIERKRFSTGRHEHRLGTRDMRPPLADRQKIFTSIQLDEESNSREFRVSVIAAIEDLVYQVNLALETLSKYINQDGQLVKGGLARGSVDGKAISDAVVDEFQTMGSTLTDDQWSELE